MNTDRSSKAMVAGGVGLLVVAGVILFLFVLPSVRGAGTPSAAQDAAQAPKGEMPMTAVGGGPGMPGMGGAGMPGGMGGMPGGMGGMPGGMGGMPGGMGGMPGGMGGMPGGMGGMPGAGTAVVAADLGGAVAGKSPFPLEAPRSNPFIAQPGQRGSFETSATTYGPDWSRIPNTLRLGFTQLTYPRTTARPALPPPTSERFARITGIAYSRGSVMASYERPDGRIGMFRPGDIVEKWEVLRITRDAVSLRHTETGEQQELSVRGGS